MTVSRIMIIVENHRNEVSVMNRIISIIINFLNRINKILWNFIIFLSKFIRLEEIDISNKPTKEEYRQFKVDEPAITDAFINIEHKEYKQLIKDNNIKPIKRRNGKDITIDIKCPCCGAPKDYLYDNTGKQNQFECKVCKFIFSYSPKYDTSLRCPHCTNVLTLRASRNDFDVYVCKNMNCPYYLRNLASLTLADQKKFETDPTLFKMHYIYRKFNIDLPTITNDFKDFLKSPININRAYSSQYIIGLCLTYHVNYGMSYRQTASLLNDIHQVKLSYKTVENYCKSVSSIVQYILEFYPYDLSDTIAADETYIKILGKTNYIFFYFDAIKKIVTSYRVFEKRDSLSSIKACYSTLSKYKKLPLSLKVISDGNPIYNVAVQYWTEQGMPFKLYQVIGLTNKDEVSKEYRPQKQIIERHNRTLKYYYRPKGGFTSLDNANSYMILFSTCFNFLRPHSALKYKVPVEIPEVQDLPNMPAKWIELINLSYQYFKTNN